MKLIKTYVRERENVKERENVWKYRHTFIHSSLIHVSFDIEALYINVSYLNIHRIFL